MGEMRSLGSASGMVTTPWGTSDSLRERMLRPGPGNRAEEVAQNQRERIFGAMVASVSERGYTATRVSDLVELSGVSSRTFYDLFTDKETCFLATTEAVLGIATGIIAKADAASGDRGWEERALSALRAFARLIESQPAAARVCLIEAHGAGPEALNLLDKAVAGFESLTTRINSESPERAEMPAEMITAYVGALQEVARNCLRQGTTAELPEQIEAVAQVILTYRPPPQPLRLATRAPAARPEDLDAHNHAERAMRGFAVVVAERGYAQTTVDEVIARASMSATTFYANFSGKEDVLMAAIDSAGAQMAAAVVPAFERSSDWPSGVRSAFGAMFSFLATRPALAHLMAVGVYEAGQGAMERRARALAPLSRLIDSEGPIRDLRSPKVTLDVIAGAVFGLGYRQVRQGGPESLPALAPICTYLTLAPFIGVEDACAAANGDGRGRGSGPELGQRQVLSKVLASLNQGEASVEMISRRVGFSEEEVRDRISNLERAGWVVPSKRNAEGEASADALYRVVTDWIEHDTWSKMSLSERKEISALVVELATGEIARAIAQGTFDARVDRHLSRLPMVVDEQGWQQLMEVHAQALHAAIAIQAESAERLNRSGEPGITANSIQAMFEAPDLGVALSDHPLGRLQRQRSGRNDDDL
jgi:AcrR family transcriptional regulator